MSINNLGNKLQMLLIATFILTVSGLNAQIQKPQMQSQTTSADISDAQLEKFSKVAGEVQKIQQSSQAEMRKVISKQGLDMQTFSKISRAQRSSDSIANFTDEQMKKFKTVQTKLGQKQEQVRQKIFKKIENEGMSLQEYKKIARGIQSNPKLQSRFQALQNKSGE